MEADASRRPIQDPEAALERALIGEFLHERGYDAASLHALPDDQAKRLLAEACAFAARKLAEVAARAHYIDELHGKE
jgi:hypothetical protein